MTVEAIKSLEGAYGVTGLHKMHDADGNDVVWFASGLAEWLEVGSTYRVKLTPKDHSEYNGRKQTSVSRVTVIEKIEEKKEEVASC